MKKPFNYHDKTRFKKVRCTCVRCGSRKMEAAVVDRTIPYLCQNCDDKFIFWQNTVNTVNEKYHTLDVFLAQNPQ